MGRNSIRRYLLSQSYRAAIHLLPCTAVSQRSNQMIKTDHNGAKNGGGHWGTRHEAKKLSSKLRRKAAKTEIKNQLAG